MSFSEKYNGCKTMDTCLKERKTNADLLKNIEKQLNCDHYPVNINELKNFCYYGYCTDDLRAKLWKMMLGYHNSRNKFKNKQYFEDRRNLYHEYLEKALDLLAEDPSIDQVLTDDVDRTIIQPIYTSKDGITTKNCHFLDSKCKNGSHRDTIKRILLTFRVTNSTVGYVQGMSSILIPIYYVFASSKTEEDVKFSEEDAYFCFFNLMSEIGENFVDKLDNDVEVGIYSKIKSVVELIKILDPTLAKHLEEIKIFHEGGLYLIIFKWITLLFMQEFKISEVIWLWDRIFSDCERFEMIIFCSVARISIERDFLLKAGYDDAMKKLQDTKSVDPEEMFVKADEFRKKFYRNA